MFNPSTPVRAYQDSDVLPCFATWSICTEWSKITANGVISADNRGIESSPNCPKMQRYHVIIKSISMQICARDCNYLLRCHSGDPVVSLRIAVWLLHPHQTNQSADWSRDSFRVQYHSTIKIKFVLNSRELSGARGSTGLFLETATVFCMSSRLKPQWVDSAVFPSFEFHTVVRVQGMCIYKHVLTSVDTEWHFPFWKWIDASHMVHTVVQKESASLLKHASHCFLWCVQSMGVRKFRSRNCNGRWGSCVFGQDRLWNADLTNAYLVGTVNQVLRCFLKSGNKYVCGLFRPHPKTAVFAGEQINFLYV